MNCFATREVDSIRAVAIARESDVDGEVVLRVGFWWKTPTTPPSPSSNNSLNIALASVTLMVAPAVPV